jgi:subtilase family serine protease
MATRTQERRLTQLADHGPMPGAVALGEVPPTERFDVAIVLRRRPDGPALPSVDDLGRQAVRSRRYLTSEEFEARFGADPDDVATVSEFAREEGLAVTDVDLARRTVRVTGTAARFERAFAVDLRYWALGHHVFRGHAGPVSLPPAVADLVVAVVGLDERPVAARVPTYHPGSFDLAAVLEAHRRAASATQRLQADLAGLQQRSMIELDRHPEVAALREHVVRAQQAAPSEAPPGTQDAATIGAAAGRATAAAIGATRDFHEAARDTIADATRRATLEALEALGVKTPPQVAELYDFPADTDGSGECIAIIELGGGYDHDSLEQYFAFLDIPMPDVSDVLIAGGVNRPGISEPVDGEVSLDIEVIGGAAPGARLVCYFGPLTGLGFVEAIHTAVHDRVNRPSVISASWDLSEAFWLQMPGLVDLMEEVLAEAALLGITVVCSAGDYGTPTEFHDGRAWVDYPASSPHVIACGGTTLASSGAAIVAETVWNTSAAMGQATGGGFSQMFPVPAWQQDVTLPTSLNAGAPRGRGVPDVAANADPRTGYLVQVTGAGTRIICGTSSGAPLWAALIARINQRLGTRVGFINPLLYGSKPSEACRDVIDGDNVFWYGSTGLAFPGYRAAPGWDAVTGWGSPSGTRLCELLGGT